MLCGVSQLGIDTVPFIYFVEKHPVYFDRVEIIFKQIDASQLTEVLSHSLKLGKMVLVADYLLNSVGFQVVRVDVKIGRSASCYLR
jgi:hypothetical protein